MKTANLEEGLDSLGINDFTYEYEKLSTRREIVSKSLKLPSKPKFPIIYPLILISFLLGFNVGVDKLDDFDLDGQAKSSNAEKKYKKQSLVELMGEVSKQKSTQERILKQLLGREQFNIIFENPSIMENIFVMEPLSKERLIRRLIIKILQAQVNDVPPQDIHHSTQDLYTSSTFIWATGGDSAAAGHGNLFQQSYTPILEDTVKGAFRALGIQFQGRNYAMGGYTSAPELALCMEAIYGNDLDVLAWDFSMTEEVYTHWHGDEGFTNSEDKEDMSYKVSLWGHRAGIHPTKPILLMMDSSKTRNRWKKISNLVERGMGSVLMDSEGMSELIKLLPITKTINPTKEDIEFKETLPPLLQYLRCDNDAIEGSLPCNDPMNYMYCLDEESSVCRDHKYDTQEACSDARNQRSYNPGWKMHFLKAKLLGHFLMEMLNTALSEIDEYLLSQTSNKYTHHYGNKTEATNQNNNDFTRRNIQSLLNYLQSKDDGDKALFHNTPPASHEWITHLETLSQVSRNVLYRSHSICHTALLPSQTRYEGIMTETNDSDREIFDLGTNKFYLKPVEDGILPLVWDPNDRQKCEALEIDHKDFFFVRTDDDWVSTVVPNPSELQIYGSWGKQLSEREGLIMVCLRYCPFRKCQAEYVGFDALQKGVLSMKVDDKPVIGAKKLDECFFLQGHQGIRWGTEKDQYKISFKIEPKTGKWMKVTSIIIF